MGSTLRFFLPFLRRIVSFFRRRLAHSAHRPYYIFSFLSWRFSSPRSKESDGIRRSIESRPATPPAVVICRLPPPLNPIADDDSNSPVIATRTPIPIQTRQPSVSSHGDFLSYATSEDQSTEYQDADGYFLEEGRQVSRSPDSAGRRDEPESTHIVPPPNQEIITSNSPVIPSRPTSHPPSQYSHRRSQYTGHRPSSQHSHRPPQNPSGAEAAAHRHLRTSPPPGPPSPAPSVRAPSVAGSITSPVYRAPGPTTRVRRPSPVRNASQRRGRSSTPASRQSMHEAPPDVSPFPRFTSQTSVSIRHGPHSVTVSFEPLTNPKCVLRPMIGVARYEKQELVIIDDIILTHVLPPVTTEFVR